MPGASYLCRFCRESSEPQGASCPHCGAPVNAQALASSGGWEEQPPIADMARIQFGRSQLQIVGGQVPVADFALAEGDWIFFATRTLLWADESVRLAPMPTDWNRVRGGLPLYIAAAAGPGRVGISGDHLGQMIALPLTPGQGIWVREHTLLAATAAASYTFEKANLYVTTTSSDENGTSTDYHYPVGRYGDVFSATNSPALVLLHSPGDTFLRDLAAGEEVLIRPGALLYKDLSVTMSLHTERANTSAVPGGYFRSLYRYLLLRLRGPGRIAVQSVFEIESSNGTIHSDPPATEQAW